MLTLVQNTVRFKIIIANDLKVGIFFRAGRKAARSWVDIETKRLAKANTVGRFIKAQKYTRCQLGCFFFQLSFSQRYISVLDNSIIGKDDFLIILPNNPYPVDLVLIQNFHFWIITKIDPKEKAPALI